MSLQESYIYRADLQWLGKRNGRMAVDGMPELFVSAPAEFSGEPGLWTPEHLLVAATASCLMTTFVAIAEISKLKVISYKSSATATLQKVPEGGYRFTEITIVPEIEVNASDREKTERILSKAEKNCFISNSLRANVTVRAKIVTEEVVPVSH